MLNRPAHPMFLAGQLTLSASMLRKAEVTAARPRAGNEMLRRNAGRILITGSIAGSTPGNLQAVYNATMAFLESFSASTRCCAASPTLSQG
jgi:NAD(P)-dependent dehydrogenase (short-subunit alcohol dehydrogenase family)